ncbi:hypothetical protein PTTW11_11413 [Pyrenophora teres f. teres]|uniref:Integrase catalytic domain-containing protein n=1 Tax=Pyrenophora teres f. teres TaxID=97479 RepID=A0A6S6WLU8_9PLEO|nr:hypothetical protein PTTW11_11413 [Pyrenophora teres f. teres]
MADSESNSSNIDVAVQEQLLNEPSEHSTSEREIAPSLWAKFTAKYLMGDCPYTVALDVINTSLWDVPVTEDANEAHATTWVAKMIHDYNLAMVDRNTLKSLKTVLRYRGIYTGNNRARVADSLYKTLAMDDIPKWDPAEFQAMTFDHRSKAYQRQNNARRITPTTEQPHQPGPTAAARQPQQDSLPVPQDLQQAEQYEARQSARSQEPPPVHQNTVAPESQYMSGALGGRQPRQQWAQGDRSQSWRPQTQRPPTTAYREITPFPQQPIMGVPDRPPELPYDPYKTLPPRWSRNDRLNANTITQFSKIWDNSKKYTGDAYDLLDDKIKIFFSICWQVDIKEEEFHAVFPRILTGRAEMFYIQIVERDDSFASAYMAIKNHFDHDVHHQHYYTDWTTTNFARTRIENPEKGLQEVLQILLDKLQLCQRALGKNFEGEDALRTTVINACRGVPELEMALFKPALICEGLFSDLRSAIETHLARQHTTQMLMGSKIATEDQYYLDRRYNSNGRDRGGFRGGSRGGFSGGFRGGQAGNRGSQRFNSYDSGRGFKLRWKKKCFVCQKEGCWSTNHTDEERKAARAQFVSACRFADAQPPADFSVYLAEYEGIEHVTQYNQQGWREEETYEDEDDDGTASYVEQQFFTEQCLADQAFLHHISGDDIYCRRTLSTPASQFLIEDRYARSVYQGILPDTGAANVSTVGREQYLALTREDPTVTMNISTAGKASIKFGKGSVTASIGTVQVSTEIGNIDFEVLEAPTPFLLCLADMDRLNVYFNNTIDELVQGEHRIPVIRKWGHPWFHLNKRERATMFLTETELRRLHRRFRHPAVMRLVKLLKNAGHNDFEERTLEEITKFCHHCQLNSSAPRQFKFTLKDDRHFNYEILVDVIAISAKETWQALRMLWIDTYQGPPDILTHDAGTNFASAEFRAEAKIMGTMSDEAILQMAVKAVNDTTGPDGLVPTLLVFGAYPRMTTESPPSPSMIKRSEAIQKATKALRKIAAERQVSDALNTRNGPTTGDVLALPLQSEVLVWRESDGWNGPYKIISPYYRPDHLWTDPDAPHAPPTDNKDKPEVYITKKEEADHKLAIKLRNDRVITTLGTPFEASDDQEISDLVGRGVFEFEQYDKERHGGIRIFKSRLVREVKGKTTKPYEKSRLVIQGYQDHGKEAILTQSPTIQRCSQRVIMALAPVLVQRGMSIELRDITQAYPQAQINLQRTILAHLPRN